MNPELWMKRAFELALLGQGHTSPNPMAGAVLVSGDEVVGEGFHRQAGLPHAEVEAVNNAREKARGATLYINLEPCSHQGRTPPCTELLKKAGIKKVVAAMTDPNPDVNGKGIAALREAGIDVEVGLLEEKARHLNEVFVKWVRTRIPFVILKWGMTLDGKIAAGSGESEWITSEKSRQRVHDMRSQCDVILVGVNTILKDDPLLTSRIPQGRNPLRVVLDSSMQTPLHSRILKTIPDAQTWIIVSEENRERQQWLEELGAVVLRFPGPNRRVDLPALLRYLGEHSYTSVLVEGGARVHGAFLEQSLADKLVFFIAPKIVGSSPGGVNSIEGWGCKSIRDALKLKQLQVSRLEDDIVVEGYV